MSPAAFPALLSGMRDSRRWIRIAAWIVATGLVVLLLLTVDVSRFGRVMTQADPRWLVAAVLSNLAIQPFGAMQWRALLPAGVFVTRRRMVTLFSLTSVANNTTPSLIGHATGALLLAAEPGVGKAASLSVLALDQLCVGIVKIGILLSAAALLPLPEWIHQGLAGLAIAVAALLVTAAVIASRTRHLDALRDPRRFTQGLAFAILVKLAEAGAILAVQQSFGLALDGRSVLLVLAATALGSVVPIAPANIGTYEAATYGAYRFLGLSAESALGIAVVQHVCQLLPEVGAGYLMLSLARFGRTIPSL
jgi:uncharacterized membrane protein YbhN (UPF0104 family)